MLVSAIVGIIITACFCKALLNLRQNREDHSVIYAKRFIQKFYLAHPLCGWGVAILLLQIPQNKELLLLLLLFISQSKTQVAVRMLSTIAR